MKALHVLLIPFFWSVAYADSSDLLKKVADAQTAVAVLLTTNDALSNQDLAKLKRGVFDFRVAMADAHGKVPGEQLGVVVNKMGKLSAGPWPTAVDRILIRTWFLTQFDPILDMQDTVVTAFIRDHHPILIKMTDADSVTEFRAEFIAAYEKQGRMSIGFFKAYDHLNEHEREHINPYMWRFMSVDDDYIRELQRVAALPGAQQMIIDAQEANRAGLRAAAKRENIVME